MIKFFRRIRQKMLSENKFHKYLLYAIGEIILVVIGILIALSINNWNEGRKERIVEQNYLRRLLIDLESDFKILTFSKGLSQARINQIQMLNNVSEYSKQGDKNSEQIVISIEKVTWRSYLPLSKIVYNELLNSGKMSLIQSEKLRNVLSNYYADADHWEMILNVEDAQKEFSHATAGLLSTHLLTAIENSSSLRNSNPNQNFEIEFEENEIDKIIHEFSKNDEALKWLPQIHHYHILADKVITNLSIQNETLRDFVQDELKYRKHNTP